MTMEMLPYGRRYTDPPPQKQSARWRVLLAARKYPVQIALAIALAVVAYPVNLLVAKGKALQHATEQVEQAQHDLERAVDSIQVARTSITGTFCRALNDNGSANNRQSRVLQRLIIGGTRQGAVFEPLYRQFGGPPFSERLKGAKRAAKDLDRFNVTRLDCAEMEARVSRGDRKP